MSDGPPHWRPFIGYMFVTMGLFLGAFAVVYSVDPHPVTLYAAGVVVGILIDPIQAYFRDADEWRDWA